MNQYHLRQLKYFWFVILVGNCTAFLLQLIYVTFYILKMSEFRGVIVIKS